MSTMSSATPTTSTASSLEEDSTTTEPLPATTTDISNTENTADSTATECVVEPAETSGIGMLGIVGRIPLSLQEWFRSSLVFSIEEETGIVRVQVISTNNDEQEERITKDETEDWKNSLPQQLSDSELISINETSCRGLPLEQVQEAFVASLSQSLSLTFQLPQGGPWTKQLLVFKSTNETIESTPSPDIVSSQDENDVDRFFDDINLVWVPRESAVVETTTWQDEDKAEPLISDAESTNGVSEASPEPSADQEEQETPKLPAESTTEETTSTLPIVKDLCLGAIPRSACKALQQSPLEEGDCLLSVNDMDDIQDLDPDTAKTTLVALYQCASSHLSIVVHTPPHCRNRKGRNWRERLQKSIVTVGGSTLLGAGALLMVTPLHPVGHAMAVGGVAVLGTEYEKPRQMAQQAKTSLRRIGSRLRRDSASERGDDDGEAVPMDTEEKKEEMNGQETSGTDTSNPPPMAQRAQARFRNFANRFRKETSEETTEEDKETTETAPRVQERFSNFANRFRRDTKEATGSKWSNLMHRFQKDDENVVSITDAAPEPQTTVPATDTIVSI